MNIRSLVKICLSSTVLLLSLSLAAYGQDEHKLSLNIGAGYTPVVGKISNDLQNGWNISGGAGYAFSTHFETDAEVGYNSFGLTNALLSSSGAPGGNAHLWSFTADPKIRIGRERKIDAYLVGAVGYYRRTITFTQPTVVPVIVGGPFFGFFPVLAPANQVLGDFTQAGIGGAGGAGFDVKLGSAGVRFFSEARYTYADTGNTPTRIIPITLGIRW